MPFCAESACGLIQPDERWNIVPNNHSLQKDVEVKAKWENRNLIHIFCDDGRGWFDVVCHVPKREKWNYCHTAKWNRIRQRKKPRLIQGRIHNSNKSFKFGIIKWILKWIPPPRLCPHSKLGNIEEFSLSRTTKAIREPRAQGKGSIYQTST